MGTAEEYYFNQDDDEGEHIPIVSTPHPRGILTGKRKRPPRNTGIPVGALTAFSRDHLLIKQEDLGRALRVLGEHVAELC